jgi:hypothetical protein
MIDATADRHGDVKVGHVDVSPTVYLDHWALRTLSEDERLAGRLVATLKSRRGTLAISWLNVGEFAKVTSAEQARKAETLVEASLPQVFFLEVEPFKVIEREDRLLAGGPPEAPHADLELLEAFVLLKPEGVQLLTAHELFRIVQGSSLVQGLDGLADTVVDRVYALRNEVENDPELRKLVQRLPAGVQIQRGTRFVLRELVRSLLIDQQLKVTRNHAVDLLHAVVPVAYCDFVLLDKHWEAQVERVAARLKAAGLSVPLARVFSGKAGQLDRFFAELEAR